MSDAGREATAQDSLRSSRNTRLIAVHRLIPEVNLQPAVVREGRYGDHQRQKREPTIVFRHNYERPGAEFYS